MIFRVSVRFGFHFSVSVSFGSVRFRFLKILNFRFRFDSVFEFSVQVPGFSVTRARPINDLRFDLRGHFYFDLL